MPLLLKANRNATSLYQSGSALTEDGKCERKLCFYPVLPLSHVHQWSKGRCRAPWSLFFSSGDSESFIDRLADLVNVFHKMKLSRLLAAIGALLLFTSSVFARPQFVGLDVEDPMNRPEDLGYHIIAERNGADIVFRVALDQTASDALYSASVFFDVPDRARPKFTVSINKTKDGKKRLTFKIPERYVKPYTTDSYPNHPVTVSCVLHLPSLPIREQDRNASAYRLRLDNITPE
jgi:hypothetical protein